jgi:hypothetical protein
VSTGDVSACRPPKPAPQIDNLMMTSIATPVKISRFEAAKKQPKAAFT